MKTIQLKCDTCSGKGTRNVVVYTPREQVLRVLMSSNSNEPALLYRAEGSTKSLLRKMINDGLIYNSDGTNTKGREMYHLTPKGIIVGGRLYDN